jgi:hypothetical protein
MGIDKWKRVVVSDASAFAHGSPWFLLIGKPIIPRQSRFKRLPVLTTKIIKDLMDQG